MRTLKIRKQLLFILSVIFAGTVLNAQERVKEVPTEGIVGYFSFDKTSGTDIICDKGIAIGKNGVITGASISADSKRGKSLDINPEKGDSYVSFDKSNSKPFVFNGTMNMSVATWVKPRTLNKTRQTILSVNSIHGGNTYYLEISENNEFNAFISTVSVDGTKKYGNAYAKGLHHRLKLSAQDTWIHVAFTFNGASTKLYINGELAIEETVKTPGNVIVPWSNQLYIGATRKDGKNITASQFDGKIDELYFYNRALNVAEVKILMNSVDPIVAK